MIRDFTLLSDDPSTHIALYCVCRFWKETMEFRTQYSGQIYRLDSSLTCADGDPNCAFNLSSHPPVPGHDNMYIHALKIYEKFLEPGSAFEVNVSAEIREMVHRSLKGSAPKLSSASKLSTDTTPLVTSSSSTHRSITKSSETTTTSSRTSSGNKAPLALMIVVQSHIFFYGQMRRHRKTRVKSSRV